MIKVGLFIGLGNSNALIQTSFVGQAKSPSIIYAVTGLANSLAVLLPAYREKRLPIGQAYILSITQGSYWSG